MLPQPSIIMVITSGGGHNSRATSGVFGWLNTLNNYCKTNKPIQEIIGGEINIKGAKQNPNATDWTPSLPAPSVYISFR